MRGRLLIVLLVLVSASATAQPDDFLSRAELMAGGGGMGYMGDLNNQSVFAKPGAAAGGGVRYRLDNRWSVCGAVRYGSVGCDHDWLERRNLSFRSSLLEGTVTVHFNFRPFGPGVSEARWTPYLYGGLGVFHFGPEASYTDDEGVQHWVALQPLGTEGQYSAACPDRSPYQLVQLSLPFGVGVRVRLNKTFTVSAEYGFRKTWTDYLDDVSTTYAGSEALDNGQASGSLAARLADRSPEVDGGLPNAPGIKRGDDSLDDWYTCFHLTVGVSFESLLGWTRPKRCKL